MSKSEKKVSNEEKYQGSLTFQIILLVVFGLAFTWIFYKPTVVFRSNDELPPIVPLTPNKILEMGGHPVQVETGIYVRDIPEFEIVKGKIVADLTIWFLFDPRMVSLNRLSKFTIEGAKILSMSEPYTHIEKGKILARYDVRADIVLQLRYDDFPLDDHRINIVLTNYHLSPAEAVFESSRSDLVLNPEIEIPGWEPIDRFIETGFLDNDLDPYEKGKNILHPRILFAIDFARIGFRQILTIILPLLLIFMVTLFSWTFNPFGIFASGSVSLAVAAISAVVMHHFVIDAASPDTGYFMLSNYTFLLILLYCSIIFFVDLISEKVLGVYKDIMALSMYIILLVFFIGLIKPFS